MRSRCPRASIEHIPPFPWIREYNNKYQQISFFYFSCRRCRCQHEKPFATNCFDVYEALVKTPTKKLDKCVRKKITLLLNRHKDYLKYKILDCRKFIMDFQIECRDNKPGQTPSGPSRVGKLTKLLVYPAHTIDLWYKINDFSQYKLPSSSL